MAKKKKYLEVGIRKADGIHYSLYDSINQVTKELGISRTTINRSLSKADTSDKWVKNGTMKFEWTNKKPKVSVEDNQPVGIIIGEHTAGLTLRILYPSLSECSRRWGISRYRISKAIETGESIDISEWQGEAHFYKANDMIDSTLDSRMHAILQYMEIQTSRNRAVIPIEELLGYGLIDNIYLPRCSEILELWRTEQISFRNNNTCQLMLS